MVIELGHGRRIRVSEPRGWWFSCIHGDGPGTTWKCSKRTFAKLSRTER
jgi:hypothetical protein